MAQRMCEKCNRMLDEKEFYSTYRTDKYPDGKLNVCKKCLTMHVDNWDPETYKWILEECDVPYVQEKWDALLSKWLENHDPKSITGVTILGRYLSSMKIKPWGNYRWADTERLAEESRQKRISSMKSQGYSDEDIQTNLQTNHGPEKPKNLVTQDAVGTPEYYDPEQESDEFSDQLTEADRVMLRLKWGRGYRPEEWVRLEQLYEDFRNSYDIQTAGHKDTLIMVCKASLKANQLFDAGDIDGANKMVKVYNDLMKSGNFQAVQNKGETGNFVDSIGEIVALCERDGYIERYYVAKPNDKVDETIEDMHKYTKSLVDNETNLSELIEGAIRTIQREDSEDSASPEDLVDDNDMSIADIEKQVRSDVEDYQEFADFLDDEAAIDEEAYKSFRGDDV